MDTSTAIMNRRSTRAFLPDTVDRDLIEQLFETARRSPSGSNLQPWHVHAISGEPLSALIADVQASIAANPRGEGSEYVIYPDGMAEPYRSRRFKCGEDMYATIGVERENKLGRMMQFAQNYRFFGAPVGLFFSIDRKFGSAQWAHLGMFMQTLMLLATERGLATCAQESWAAMNETVRRHIALPDHLMLYCGMALGYPNPEAPVNRLVTDRAEVSDFATLIGFG
jgi:nitroreductase